MSAPKRRDPRHETVLVLLLASRATTFATHWPTLHRILDKCHTIPPVEESETMHPFHSCSVVAGLTRLLLLLLKLRLLLLDETAAAPAAVL